MEITQWGRAPFTNKLFKKRVTSAETAYKPGLYAVSSPSSDKQQIIEREIFGRLDNDASKVMQKILRRSRVTANERTTWAFYLNASVIRVAHLVDRMRSEMRIRLKEMLDVDLPEYNAVRGNAAEATLYEWAQKHVPHEVANAGLNVLIQMIRNEKTVARIINLQWTVRDISSTGNHLMLGDDPVHREVPLHSENACWLVPLSPSQIFFAAENASVIDHFNRMTARDVVQQSNIRSLRNARQFAYGTAACSFIEQHLLVGGA